MKQIEVTLKVNSTLEEIDTNLKKQGFNIIRKSRIEDKYMCSESYVLNKNNILDVLNHSVLLRYLCVDNKETFKKITYKNKIYENNTVISEEKINVNVDNLLNAERLLNAVGFKKLVDVNYDVIVYQKDKLEFCFQNVENLGILLEYENEKDFEGKTNEEILSCKKNMVEEIKKYGLLVDDDYDIKKAYELIKQQL